MGWNDPCVIRCSIMNFLCKSKRAVSACLLLQRKKWKTIRIRLLIFKEKGVRQKQPVGTLKNLGDLGTKSGETMFEG